MQEYELPDLPYAYDALEPYCSAETMELHHSAHHAAYVKGANKTLERLAAAREERCFDTINGLSRDFAFHVSGHILHSLFWTCMAPGKDSQPSNQLFEQIAQDFGDLDSFRRQFWATARGIQGSGWAALSMEPHGHRLVVHQLHDHHSNLTPAAQPLLVLDMWEHAYYGQYQNRKSEWLDAFWNLIDWQEVSNRFAGHDKNPGSS